MIVLKNTPINQIFYILRNSKNGSDCWDLTHSNVEYNSNGTFTIAPPEGYDGLSYVTVKVDVKCSGITTSESEINSSNDGGDYTIGISSGYSWTATASEDWITVTPSSGEGGVAVITITVSENEGEERTGTVTIVNDNGDVNVIEITQEGGTTSIPLTIEAITDGTLSIKCGQNLARTIEFSIDDGETWNSVTSSTSGTEIATLNAGDKVQLRGDNESYGFALYGNTLAYTGDFNVSGNIMSLISSTNYSDLTELQGRNNFANLFSRQSGLINAEGLLLPATTLTEYCYFGMFNHCTNLATAPTLPATTLATKCYWEMFKHCTNLATAPTLPATILADSCYNSMFSFCTNLVTAPELPATELARECYTDMFMDCTSLAEAPKLPATTLATKCYWWMFYGCTSLTTAPELPATILTECCYNYMFGHTSITTAPELPATTLAPSCYSGMFIGCKSLVQAPELPVTTLAERCYSDMFEDCTSLTTAPELPATTLVKHCYNSMFYSCSKLNYIKCLATVFPEDICTERFTSFVSPTGTFVCPDPSVWTTGANGIPSGWTVETI